MIKQIFHILLFTVLSMMLLSSIANGQELTYYNSNESIDDSKAETEVSEEILESIYKYDLPAEETTVEMEFDHLPAAIQKNYSKSKYNSWAIVKVFEIKHDPKHSFIITVEKKGYLKTLHYNYKGDVVEKF